MLVNLMFILYLMFVILKVCYTQCNYTICCNTTSYLLYSMFIYIYLLKLHQMLLYRGKIYHLLLYLSIHTRHKYRIMCCEILFAQNIRSKNHWLNKTSSSPTCHHTMHSIRHSLIYAYIMSLILPTVLMCPRN